MLLPDFLGFSGSKAIVTGGSSGIGRSIAENFAKNGASVVVVGRNVNELSRTVELCRELVHEDARISFVESDLNREESAEHIVSQSVSLLGGIDVLINAAAVIHREPIDEEVTDAEKWDEIMRTNLRSPYLLSKHARKHLAEAEGSIVNISSIWAHIGARKQVAYSTSKSALVELTRSMALDFAPARVRVNCVCPGTIKTPLLYKDRDSFDEVGAAQMHPLGRIGTVEDVAAAVLFLSSKRAANWITGSVLTVDGGYTIQ